MPTNNPHEKVRFAASMKVRADWEIAVAEDARVAAEAEATNNEEAALENTRRETLETIDAIRQAMDPVNATPERDEMQQFGTPGEDH